MEKIITNKNNLKEEEMTEVVERVKLLIVNSKNEILLCNSHNDYHFPGGHVEDNETLLEAINRELTEETGMELNIKNISPFAQSLGYYKDWPSKGKNRKIIINYYEIKTDEKVNLNNVNYTEQEKDGNFKVISMPLDKVEEELIKNKDKYGDNKGIIREMLDLLKIYKKIRNQNEIFNCD